MQLYALPTTQINRLSRQTPVVIPVAALEQHGPHMPVLTDTLLLEGVLARVMPHFENEVLFAPIQWLGNSDHHLEFPGTMSAGPRTYLNLLKDMASNFLDLGFERILFLNGHGGNITPGKQAVFELRQERRTQPHLLLLFATYWDQAQPTSVAGHAFVQTEMGHACEWETSMMLALRPELVGDYQSLPEVPFATSQTPAYRGWITQERSAAGYIGNPAAASAEKGELLVSAFASGNIELLKIVCGWDGKSWPV